jgi:glycosyltransferase involved in cell wall biosynthesis
MTTLHFVVPDGIDDPARPSGGNSYDRRLRDGLVALGWDVRSHLITGEWPRPDEGALRELADTIAGVPDGALTLVDGLIASAAPGVLVGEAARVRLVVLVHMPLDEGGEGAVLAGARAVVTTSGFTRARLLTRYRLRPERVHVAEPGVDPAPVASGGDDALLCVAAVTPHKGHDVLVRALARLRAERWHCDCVGSTERDPGYVTRVLTQASADGIAGRVRFRGPLTGDALERAYRDAGVLVLASRAETYGMVVTEALARGLPVIASDIGGVPDALGRDADGRMPGLLVPPGDDAALAGALRDWLHDGGLRHRLRAAARARRDTLRGWPDTVERIAAVLHAVAAPERARAAR